MQLPYFDFDAFEGKLAPQKLLNNAKTEILKTVKNKKMENNFEKGIYFFYPNI